MDPIVQATLIGSLSKSFHAPRGGIAVALLARVLLFSTVVTLIVTAAQLMLSYQAEVSGLQSRFNEIQEGYARGLGNSLWALDGKLVGDQLDGILRLPLIRYVEVRETHTTHPLTIFRGSRQAENVVVREFPIYCCDKERRQIGILHLEASLTDVYQVLLRQAFVILVSNAMKTFLVALFILLMVHRLATRHLSDIATALRVRTPGTAPVPLMLRRPKRKLDELDQLVDAINMMVGRLEQHASELGGANAQMAAILDNIPDLAWVKDTDGRYVAANRALARALGYDEPVAMIGKTDFNVHPPEQALAYRADDAEVMASGRRKRVEERHPEADGRWTWVETIKTPFSDGRGRLAGTVGIARDVTERKKMEEDLRRSEALQAEGQRLSQTGSWSWHIPSGTVVWSDEHFRIFGFAPGEVKPSLDVVVNCIHPDDRPMMQASIADAIGAPQNIEHEFRVIWPDGSARYVSTVARTVLDESGVINEFIGVAVDITARRQAEAEREARHAAETANRAKGEFLAMISHELRTPLNGILGYAQILLRDDTLGEKYRNNINVIQQSGLQLLTLINDVLDFSKIEAGKLELSLSDINLVDFLRSIEEIIRVRAEQKGLNFVCNVTADSPCGVRADANRLRQVLLNLLANAVKFTDQGSVTFNATLRAGDSGLAYVRFEVRDTGIGIGDEHQTLLFRPFEQLGEESRRIGGTGLGLAISQQFVKLMGGEVRVESRVNSGSTFWFELQLPVTTGEIGGRQPTAIATGYRGPRKKVLVVDDVPANRAVAVDMLASLGFETFEAADGRAGIEEAERLHPDVILMDIFMPGLNGQDSIRELRAKVGSLGKVLVIATSASAAGSDKIRSLTAGADAFLSKPIEQNRLLEQIATLLKLQWTYKPDATLVVDHDTDGPIVAPSGPEMEALLYLARMGDMREIQLWAQRIGELDKRYRPFAHQLSQLAQRYQSQEILRLAEKYMGPV
jgi:PAS domain S-box-containing protein